MRVGRQIPWLGKRLGLIYDFLLGSTGMKHFETDAEMVSDLGIEWLARRDSSKPFFLWLHYIDPHGPYDPVAEYSPQIEGYSDDQVAWLRTAGLEVTDLRWTDEDVEALKSLYDGEVKYIDDQVGRILAYLDEQGLLESSVVILTSDHGEEFFEHGMLGHDKQFYEESVRVPLVMWLEGSEEFGERVGERPVNLRDLGPTLWGLLGFEEVGERNWLSENYADMVYLEGNLVLTEKKAVVGNNIKLIWDTDKGVYEAYNLSVDSVELDDIYRPGVYLELEEFATDLREKNLAAYEEYVDEGGFRQVDDFGEVVGY